MNFDIVIDRCREEMNNKNLTIRDVANLSKISAPTIYRMMNADEQNMSIATLEAVCTALNVEVYTGSFEIKEEQPSDKEAVYQARIRDLKITIAEKNKWIKRLFVFIAIIIAFLLTFLAIDFLNPNVGWVRAAAMIGMQCYL